MGAIADQPFYIMGSTSSQAEAAVGWRPDQFWSCYGVLYIFILCPLSVRLFFSLFLHDLSTIFAKPLLFSVMSIFSLSLRDVSALCSHSLSSCLVFHLLPITHQSWCCLHILFVITSLFNLKLKYQEKCPFALTRCPLSKVLQPKQEKSRRSKILFWGLLFIYSNGVRCWWSVWMASS